MKSYYRQPKSKWWSDYKKLFYIILSIAWISGVTFFILDRFFVVQGEFGVEKTPLQYPALKIHGASAFAMMVVFGYFVSAHVRKNLKANKKKPILAMVLLMMPIMSIITGYILYYIASVDIRQIVAYLHLLIGALLPIILVIHIMQMKPKRHRVQLT